MGMFSAELENTEIGVQQLMPVAGTVQNLYAFVQVVPGGTATWTLTIRKNGANTAVTCTIQPAALSCSDNTHTASFVAGDLIAVLVTSSGAPAATPGQWTAVYAPP